MKTAYTQADVKVFLDRLLGEGVVRAVQNINEGRTSQVLMYTDNVGRKWVLRIRSNYNDLLADYYANKNLSTYVAVPEVVKIDRFDSAAFYCISEFVDGVPLSKLSIQDIEECRSDVQRTMSSIYTADISSSTGYGVVDFRSGSARYESNKESLRAEVEELNLARVMECAEIIGLNKEVVDRLMCSFTSNLSYVSEVRRLLHGDPGGDNFLVKDAHVVAVLDWEQMTYGDWLRDYSRHSYWNVHSYYSADKFGRQFNLEIENAKERISVYYALHTLRNIEFAARDGNMIVGSWLHKNIERILATAVH